jgi:hypothetical protein
MLNISSFVLMLLRFQLRVEDSQSCVDLLRCQLRAEYLHPSVDVDDTPAFVL